MSESHEREGRSETAAGAPRIRAAQPGDVEGIWALMRELAVYEKLEDHMTGSPARLARNLFEGAWPPLDCFVAEEEGGLVGYALVYGCYSSFWTRPLLWLEDLYVTPARRGSGVGRDLLRAVAAFAIARDCARVDWMVLDWNEPAIGFYERLGAKRVVNEWHTYRIEGRELDSLAREPSAAASARPTSRTT